MADPSDVDAALIAKLQADAALMAITVDGIWFDVAPQGATRFVVVSSLTHDDNDTFDALAGFEEYEYLVKAVLLDTSGTNVKTAAARIQAVLQDAVLTPTNYVVTRVRRVGRVRYTEADDELPDNRWQHRGGRYAVFASPTA